jgi:hypothetical protein
MTEIFVKMSTGYCGSEGHEVIEVEYSKEELSDFSSLASRAVDEMAYEMAQENAQMYGIEDNEDEGMETDNIQGNWEIFDFDKHGGYLSVEEYNRRDKEINS